MNRGDAYTLLFRELESWRLRPYDQLVALIGQPAAERIVRIGEEDVTLRITVRWADAKKKAARIEAAADGPSCWKLDRVEESVVIRPGITAAD